MIFNNIEFYPILGSCTEMISKCGKVLALPRTEYAKNGKRVPFKKRIRGFTIDGKGYLYAYVYFKYPQKRLIKVHRLVAQAFIQNPENKPQVNHKDGCKSNNNDWNLEWVTNRENMDHAIANKLTASRVGVKNPNVSLTEIDVLIIKDCINKNIIKSIVYLAFGISVNVYNQIKFERTWKHLWKT